MYFFKAVLFLPPMKNHAKKNRNKQKLQNKAYELKLDKDKYNMPGSYKVIVVVHLGCPLDLTIKLPYNFIRKDMTTDNNLLELSYLVRSADLLILTVSHKNIDMDYVNFIKRYMPETIIVYENQPNESDKRNSKNLSMNVPKSSVNILNLEAVDKSFVKSLSKIFGDVKIILNSLLTSVLRTHTFRINGIAANRPFMVVKEAEMVDDGMILSGFMKLGLVSNKVIINGTIEATIEEVLVGERIIKGEELNVESNGLKLNRLVEEESEEDSILEEQASDSLSYEVDNYSSSIENDNSADQLIEKYKNYRGIRNLATVKFKSSLPESYRDLVFFNHNTENSIKKNKNWSIGPNQFLKIKIDKQIDDQNLVLYNLFHIETNYTIMNYSFSGTTIPKDIIVDNGFRIFRARAFVSDNLPHNAFTEKKNSDHGIVTFIAPMSLFTKTAYIYRDDGTQSIGDGNVLNGTKIVDGYSGDRLFLDSKTLVGTPLKIFKSYVVIRGMFNTPKEVEYFKNIKLEGKNNNCGFIKGSLGTKGLFKAYFPTPVKHGEKIVMRLYKRIFLQ